MKKKASSSRQQNKGSSKLNNASNLNNLTSPKFQKHISYKPNHQKLPVLIMPDHTLLIFTQTPIYKKVIPYISSFADPIYRPRKIHEYKITKFSLYTAFVLNYSAKQIISILNKLCKNKQFPQSLQLQILTYMKYAGKVKFYMELGKYYIITVKQIGIAYSKHLKFIQIVEGQTKDNLFQKQLEQQVLQINQEHIDQKIILANQIIQRQKQYDEKHQEVQRHQKQQKKKQEISNESTAETYMRLRREDVQQMGKYEVIGDYFQLTKNLIQKNVPLMQEYDFQKDKKLEDIKMQMKHQLEMRFYQARAIKNIFIDGKARSGLVILPCGAGKTLVGILAIQRIHKPSIVFCQNQVSASQWKNQMIKWTTIDPNKIVIISPDHKVYPKNVRQAYILITTYTMVGMKRDIQNNLLAVSKERQWGLCIADQVHKLPAETFQSVLKKYKFHVKLGLTATPYRQDKKIDNLFYMIGPKVYQQNWLDLVRQGCLARPYCIQIFCQMPQNFKDIYQKIGYSQLIHTGNPQKFKVLQYLIKKHTKCNDKILVFCDRPKILQYYAKILKHPFVHGQTKQNQRIEIFNCFKSPDGFNVLFLSRVGDTAIDLPCANVAIQIGMHYQSRRQQVQRMGRIMRAKYNPNDQYNAFFYSLISLGTKQLIYSKKRQKCLIDQGFEYQILLGKNLVYDGMKTIPLDEMSYLRQLLSDNQKQGQAFMKYLNNSEYKQNEKNKQKMQIEVKIGNIEDNLIYQYAQQQL